MPAFTSLKKPLLSKEVEDQIRNSIANRTFHFGDKLPTELELAEQFQVSRATVRDAIKNLQIMGLLSVKRGLNAGAYVSEPNPNPITQSLQNLLQMNRVHFGHLIEIRLYIEPDVARSVAMYHRPEDIDRLSELLAEAESQIDRSWKEARLTNVRFHCEVAKITGNALIVFLCESITQIYSGLIIEGSQKKLDTQGILKLISEHRAILNAIAAGNGEKAFEKTQRHLLETYHTYSKILPGVRDEGVRKRIMSLVRR